MNNPYNYKYLGHNVGTIFGLGGLNKDTIAQIFKDCKAKHVVAISADMNQKNAPPNLTALKFKRIITFYSSHGKHETLTLWVKSNPKVKEVPNDEVGYGIPNCTVRYGGTNVNKESVFNLSITNNKKEMSAAGFKQVGKAPIWYYTDSSKIAAMKNIKKKNLSKLIKNWQEFAF